MSSRPTLRYLSKLPPSPSGIGLYAQEFVAALRGAHVDVEVCRAPADPLATQQLRQALVGFRLGRRWGAGHTPVHIELSGRALFEFYAALGVLTRAKPPRLSVTCHDAPSVAGAVLLFRFLDRRGLRRIGLAWSQWTGVRLARRVMTRADVVFALTDAGARELATRYARPVVHLPHIVPRRAMPPKESVVFLPGYLGDVEATCRLTRHLLTVAPPTWTVRIGACPDEVRERLGGELRVAFTGFLDEGALGAEFDRATLVVRERHTEPTEANGLAASGPLSWAVAAHCACITNDRRAGARELADLGLVHLTDDVHAAVGAYFGEPTRPAPNPTTSTQARTSLSPEAVATRFLRAVDPAMPG